MIGYVPRLQVAGPKDYIMQELHVMQDACKMHAYAARIGSVRYRRRGRVARVTDYEPRSREPRIVDQTGPLARAAHMPARYHLHNT